MWKISEQEQKTNKILQLEEDIIWIRANEDIEVVRGSGCFKVKTGNSFEDIEIILSNKQVEILVEWFRNRNLLYYGQ